MAQHTGGGTGVQRRLGWLPTGETLPDDAHATRHRRITLLLFAHVPFLLALGVFSGTMPVTEAVIPAKPLWLVGGQLALLTAVTAVSRYDGLSRRQQTTLSAVGWMLATMQLVQFSGGYIEAHFHFFVAVGVLASYEDWVPFGLGLLYVVVGHGLFATVFDPGQVYNHAAAVDNPWVWGGVHGLFVTLLAASELSNWRSITESRAESQRRLETVEEQKSEMQSIEEAKAEAERRREETQQLKRALETRANEYTRQMEAAAAGDLSVRLDQCDQSEAMSDVATAFNEMLAEVEEAVDEIKLFADRVEDASETTVTRVKEAREEAATVTETIEEIAEQTTQQRDQLSQAATEMSTLSATIEEVASSAAEVSETADATAEVSADGSAAVERTITRANDVEQAATETVETVTAVDEQVEAISAVVDVIGEIADQTDMLAVNATIEAARAGGGTDGASSDGFGVVAAEVKQLAEEVQDAAADVETQLADVRAQTETAVTAAESAAADATDATEAVEQAGSRFEEVTAYVDETNDGITEISHATDDQAASTEETVTIVESALATSEQTTARADDVVATSRSQAELMGDVATDSEELTGRAQELQRLLDRFTTGGDGTETTVQDVSRPTPVADGGGN